jgi:hypothetical protein
LEPPEIEPVVMTVRRLFAATLPPVPLAAACAWIAAASVPT